MTLWTNSPLTVKQLSRQSDPLTCLFNLGFPRLGGGHDSCGGLSDAPGGLLQTVQVGAVFVCFHLQRNNSKDDKENDERSATREQRSRLCSSNSVMD